MGERNCRTSGCVYEETGGNGFMSWLTKRFPFNRVQVVNILGEMGPLIAMFLVNGIWGIAAGTYALIITTLIALVATLAILGRPPIMPFIAGAVSITFGVLTLVTGDPKWVQIKVTIFNAMFAGFLFLGLWLDRNFFQYVFEKTFHYTKEGWDTFTRSFAWFFVLTALLNELVRIGFKDDQIYHFLGFDMNGVDVWIAFKLFFVLPMSGIYAWLLTKWMSKHHL